MFLVFCQCIVNALVAWVGELWPIQGRHSLSPHLSLLLLPFLVVSWYQGQTLSLAPYGLYGTLSLSYVGAMVASNSSLAFISYPTQVNIFFLLPSAPSSIFTILPSSSSYLFQVLGKSAKPIPVLILGVLFGRRSYPLIKYLCVLLIVAGVAIFLFKDKPTQAAEDGQWRLLGVVGVGELLVVSVELCDPSSNSLSPLTSLAPCYLTV